LRDIPEAMKPRRIAINGAQTADNVHQIEAKAAYSNTSELCRASLYARLRYPLRRSRSLIKPSVPASSLAPCSYMNPVSSTIVRTKSRPIHPESDCPDSLRQPVTRAFGGEKTGLVIFFGCFLQGLTEPQVCREAG
jgi:hypothetical protein